MSNTCEDCGKDLSNSEYDKVCYDCNKEWLQSSELKNKTDTITRGDL